MSLVKNISFNMHGGCFFDQPPDVCTFGHIVDHQGVEALRFRLLTGQDGVGGVQLAFASRRVLAQAAHTDRPQSNYQRLKNFFFFFTLLHRRQCFPMEYWVCIIRKQEENNLTDNVMEINYIYNCFTLFFILCLICFRFCVSVFFIIKIIITVTRMLVFDF